MKIQLVPHAGQPSDFLHLPWDVPLEDWPEHRLVQMPRGISRHVVRFVVVDGVYYALKELPSRLAQREYRLLHALAQRSVPAVIPAGLVRGRGDDLDAVLITRHLEFSRPYRLVLAQRPSQERWDALLDALAQLLVRLHLAGFFWGDCSLSNVLFRRDAGALCAYLVDAETAAMHDVLSDGQRRHDLEIAEEHLLGEICDLAAQAEEEPGERELAIGRDVAERYDALWQELTGDEDIDPSDARRVDARIRRLNELGFDVGEIELVRDRLRRLPPAPRPARRRARPSPPPAAAPDRPRRAGEPGAAPAGGHRRLPRQPRAPRPAAGVRARGGGALAQRRVRARARGDPARAARQAGPGRAVPRAARAPLAALGARGP